MRLETLALYRLYSRILECNPVDVAMHVLCMTVLIDSRLNGFQSFTGVICMTMNHVIHLGVAYRASFISRAYGRRTVLNLRGGSL